MRQHKMLYSSSYDRGLMHLLLMWKDIKKEIPDATLDIYYGWKLFQSFYANNPERMKWKANMEKLMQQDGITEHGRVSKSELIKAQKECGIWAYPTHFCVTGDTLIDMPRDYSKYPQGIPIKELVGKKDFLVWTFNEENGNFELKNVNWVKLTKKSTEIIKINWNDGTSLKLTPNHRVLTYKRGWVEADSLEIGESVVSLKKHMRVQVSIGNGGWPLEHRVVAENKFGKIPKGYHVDHVDGNCFNNSPENLQLLSPKEHAKKTFTGKIVTNQSKEKQSASWKKWSLTEEGKKHLSENGTNRANKFWSSMTKEERQKFIKNRSEKTKAKYGKWWSNLSLEEKSKWGDKGRKTRWNHKVMSIEDAGKEDVYDMEVKDNHNFIAGGVVIHNSEINCITALSCQKNGCVPCVINYAALKETVGSGVRVEGDIYEPATRRKYLEELVSLMKDEKKWKEEQEKGYQFAKKYEWPQIAQHWCEVFKET